MHRDPLEANGIPPIYDSMHYSGRSTFDNWDTRAGSILSGKGRWFIWQRKVEFARIVQPAKSILRIVTNSGNKE